MTDARGRPIASGGLGAWLERAAPAGARGDVTIALVNDAAIRRLNRRHRGKDAATDVLSFPRASRQPRARGCLSATSPSPPASRAARPASTATRSASS